MTQGTKEPIGIAVVDKPAGLTSHDVVAKARKIFGTRKVGHSGTLDPDATGVLVLGIGRATRLLQFLTRLPKSYKGEIVFGEETSTLDSYGVVTHIHDMSGLSLSDAGILGFFLQVVGGDHLCLLLQPVAILQFIAILPFLKQGT